MNKGFFPKIDVKDENKIPFIFSVIVGMIFLIATPLYNHKFAEHSGTVLKPPIFIKEFKHDRFEIRLDENDNICYNFHNFFRNNWWMDSL